MQEKLVSLSIITVAVFVVVSKAIIAIALRLFARGFCYLHRICSVRQCNQLTMQ